MESNAKDYLERRDRESKELRDKMSLMTKSQKGERIREELAKRMGILE